MRSKFHYNGDPVHAIKNNVGPLRRDHHRAQQRTSDNEPGMTYCGKTLEEVEGMACYPSAFVTCKDCLTAMGT